MIITMIMSVDNEETITISRTSGRKRFTFSFYQQKKPKRNKKQSTYNN